MRVKTLGAYAMPTRPDVIDMSPRGMRGYGDPGSEGVLGAPVVDTSVAGFTSLTWANDRGSIPRSMAQHPLKWLFGTFAVGWLGGYLAWVAIGKRGR